MQGLRLRGWEADLVEPRLRPFHGTQNQLSARENRAAYVVERTSLALSLRRQRPRPRLHIHYGMFGAIGLASGAPFLLHFHGSDLLVDDARWHLRRLHRLAAGRAAACLVSTPDLLRFEAQLGVELVFLPNPVPTAWARVASQRNGNTGVLFASKLDANKRPEVFLPAASTLAASGVPVTVLGFGSDGASRTRELLNEVEAAGARIIRGRLCEDEFTQLLAEADIVVGQFGVGALGMTELRALAMGKAIVTHFAFPSAYGSPLPHAEARIPKEVVSAIVSLLSNDHERDELGTAGQAWVLQEHGQEAVTDRLIKIYEEKLP